MENEHKKTTTEIKSSNINQPEKSFDLSENEVNDNFDFGKNIDDWFIDNINFDNDVNEFF